MKCTPASSLTFTGTISVNGNETRYNNEVVPIPAGFNNFCISRNGKVMNVQAITPMGTYNNNINDDNGHLTGTMKFPFMTIKLDGNVARVKVNKYHRSFWLLDVSSPLRRMCIYIIGHRFFQGLILVTIVMNSVLLGVDTPGYHKPPWLETAITVLDIIFDSTFLLEMILKVTALGFVLHRHAYLRSPWNCLDFIIVVFSVAMWFGTGEEASSLSTLRLFRVLRPLRSVSRVPKLQCLVECLFRSLNMLGNSVLLIAFILIIFAIGAVQMWSTGELHQRCYLDNELYPGDTLLCGGTHKCLRPTLYFPNETLDVRCYMNLTQFENRHVNYDNLWGAFLVNFKVMSLDGWPEDVENAMNAFGTFSFVYFVLLALLGGYLCVNLFLAILTKEYQENTREQKNEQLIKDEDEHEDPPSPEQAGAKIENAQSNDLGDVDVVSDISSAASDSDNLVDIQGHIEKRLRALALAKKPTRSEINKEYFVLLLERDAQKYGASEATCAKSRWAKVARIFNLDKAQDGQHERETSNAGNLEVLNRNPVVPPLQMHEQEAKMNSSQEQIMDIPEEALSFQGPGGARGPGQDPDSIGDNSYPVALQRRGRSRSLVVVSSTSLEKAPAPRRQSEGGTHMFVIPKAGDPEVIPKNEQGELFLQWPAKDEHADVVPSSRRSSKESSKEGVVDLYPTTGPRAWLRRLYDNPWTSWTVMALTAISVLALSIDHYPIDPNLELSLDIINIVLTVVFALEFLGKLIAFGWQCLKEPFTAIDGVIVLGSIPDIALSTSTGLNAFRAVRLIRVMRLVRRFDSVRMLIRTVMGSIVSSFYLAMLLLLFVYIFAILGIQLFENFPPEVRWRFSSLWEGLMTCFVVITGDNWVFIMKTAMDVGAHPLVGAVFFLLLFGIGNYIFFSLFVAIILDNLKQHTQDSKLNDNAIARRFTAVLLGIRHDKSRTPDPDVSPLTPHHNRSLSTVSNKKSSPKSPNKKRIKSVVSLDGMFGDERVWSTRYIRYLWRALTTPADFTLYGDSCYLFPTDNVFRTQLAILVHRPIFYDTIQFLTLVSCLFIGIDASVESESLHRGLNAVTTAISCVFLLEAVVKIIVFGGYVSTHTDHVPYFKDFENCVDCAVAVLGILGIFFEFFAIFLVLRIFRILMRSENVRVVILAVLHALPHVAQGLFLCLFVFLIFGILGVQLFKGEFYHCSDETVRLKADCHGHNTMTNVTDPVSLRILPNVTSERKWVRETQHFDNLLQAAFVLFQISTVDAWSNVMFRGIDTSDVGQGPIRNNNPWVALYFITFFIIGNLFVTNIVLGLLINYFQRYKVEHDGSALMTKNQQDFLKCQKLINKALLTIDPEPPENKFRLFCYHIVFGQDPHKKAPEKKESDVSQDKKGTPLFDTVFATIIFLNAIVLAMAYRGMSERYENALYWLNFVFTILFAIEAAIKITALGPQKYLRKDWLDLSVVLMTLIALMVGFGEWVSVIRLLRVVRVLRLVRKARGLNTLFQTVIEALPALCNVAIVLLAIFYIFGVLGVYLFRKVALQGVLTANVNFRTLPQALLLLFEVSTQVGWIAVLDACMVQEPNCSEAEGTCGLNYAPIYFLTFILLSGFIALQLMIAIAVEAFTTVESELDSETQSDFMLMRELWSYKYGSRRCISCEEYFEFVRVLPVSLTGLYSPGLLLHVLGGCRVPVTRDGQVLYKDVVYGFAFNQFGIDAESLVVMAMFRDIPVIRPEVFTASQVYAAKLLVGWSKEYLERRHRNGWPDRKKREEMSAEQAHVKALWNQALAKPAISHQLKSPRGNVEEMARFQQRNKSEIVERGGS